jgi:hypothetical protein
MMKRSLASSNLVELEVECCTEQYQMTTLDFKRRRPSYISITQSPSDDDISDLSDSLQSSNWLDVVENEIEGLSESITKQLWNEIVDPSTMKETQLPTSTSPSWYWKNRSSPSSIAAPFRDNYMQISKHEIVDYEYRN